MSTVQTAWIPGRVMSMNDIVRLRASWKGAYSKEKRAYADVAVPLLRELEPVAGSAHVSIHVVESNTRRDPDNVCAGAAKCLLDCAQTAGLLGGDGWRHIASLSFRWSVNADDPGVWLSISASE